MGMRATWKVMRETQAFGMAATLGIERLTLVLL